MKKTCLVTGGLGYIGSHICVELIQNDWNVVILDNLSNSSIDKLKKIKKFNSTNSNITFGQIDLTDYELFDKFVCEYIEQNKLSINMIIHLAGLKAVGESIDLPVKYYENNLVSTLNLVKIMEKYSIANLIFSSDSLEDNFSILFIRSSSIFAKFAFIVVITLFFWANSRSRSFILERNANRT